jgi:cell cycle arrest protein BUB3
MLDIPTTGSQVIGRHEGSCSCLASLDGENSSLIASAGWSTAFNVWDVRQSSPVSTLKLPGKALDFSFDPKHRRIVVATSGRRTCFIDIRKGAKAELVLERESSLKFQTRCVRFFPDGDAICAGSVEGRVGVEYLDELGVESGMKKYAFKCHRVNDTVYPVNCIEFHPRYKGTFATGGCDGAVGMLCSLVLLLHVVRMYPNDLFSIVIRSAMGWEPQEEAHVVASFPGFDISNGIQL